MEVVMPDKVDDETEQTKINELDILNLVLVETKFSYVEAVLVSWWNFSILVLALKTNV